jgi:hypothetical protein
MEGCAAVSLLPEERLIAEYSGKVCRVVEEATHSG